MPPPSGAAHPRSGPRRETPTTHNEKITKLDRANDNIGGDFQLSLVDNSTHHLGICCAVLWE